jgi:hypothetical protein
MKSLANVIDLDPGEKSFLTLLNEWKWMGEKVVGIKVRS